MQPFVLGLGLLPAILRLSKTTRNQKPKNQNLGENLLVSAGFFGFFGFTLSFLVFASKNQKIPCVFFGFHGVASLKNQQNHVFFWFLNEKPKFARVLARFWDRETAKTKKNTCFFWFFAQKPKKHWFCWFFSDVTP